MPYTLAHPSIILPLRKYCRLSIAGLIIGAMSPDFEHVLRLAPLSKFSHSLPALFWFCLPLGLLVLWFYRSLWRPALAQLFPQLREPEQPKSIWLDGLSVLVGAFSHIGWDAFTHGGRMGVQLFPILASEIQIQSGVYLPVWNLLQHLSTGVGLLAIAMVVTRSATRISPHWPRRELRILAGLVCLLSILAVLMSPLTSADPTIKSLVVHSANNFIVLLVLALTVGGLWLKWKEQAVKS